MKHYTDEWVADQMRTGGVSAITQVLNRVAADMRLYRRTAAGDHTPGHDGRSASRGPSRNPSMEETARERRVWRAAVDIAADLVNRPPSDQSNILNDVIETCVSREVRLLLREESYVQRERFVAVRWAFEEMREKWWTAHNWLELRLKKYVPNGVYVYGHKLFSKLQDADGIWQRQVFLPIPTPAWRARQDQIYTPVWVESVFWNPPEIAAAHRRSC